MIFLLRPKLKAALSFGAPLLFISGLAQAQSYPIAYYRNDNMQPPPLEQRQAQYPQQVSSSAYPAPTMGAYGQPAPQSVANNYAPPPAYPQPMNNYPAPSY